MNAQLNILLVISASLLLNACCCFQPEPVDPATLPIVREATIAVFNSDYAGNAPAPEFNIATFQFPSNDRSSGSLPNDSRFSTGSWAFREVDYPGKGLTTFYEFFTPPNALIAGDFLVDSIFLGPSPVAIMRVRGKLLRMPANPNLLTDDANVFAKEISQYNDTASILSGSSVCDGLENTALLYGTSLNDPNLDDYTIRVEEGGQTTGVSYPTNWPTDANGTLLPPIRKPLTTDLGYYTVQFQEGDWFYYRATNGVSFFVLVTAIQQGTLPPLIRRVTFKFSESYGCYDCAK
ncbi:MAG: hypothetical protein IPI29_14425 [Ignavibacteria bacterium]|nr:hypothetical protein [Ignavibacteria bacterium]